MKVRFVLENDYGNCYETSVEMNVETIPRVGESIWIDNTELFRKALSVEQNCVFYCAGIDINSTDLMTVCQIVHDFTEESYGIYVVLVYNYEDFIVKDISDENCISDSDIDKL